MVAFEKIVLIAEDSKEALSAHVAGLDLPRRALSWPVESESPPAIPNLVELWGDPASLSSIVEAWPHPARAWRVVEHVPVAYARTWAGGEPSPGLRMISTIHRRPDMSCEDFIRYWHGPHARVAREYTVPVWHYVQNAVVEPLGHESDIDGFVGMHFRTAEAMRARWQDHPEEAARGAADAARFMDVGRSLSVTTIETVWDGPARIVRSTHSP